MPLSTHIKIQEVAGHYDARTGSVRITPAQTVKQHKEKKENEDELLKPCPFCGDTPEIHQHLMGAYYVKCGTPGCWANNVNVAHAKDNKQEVISSWNFRNPSPEDEEYSQHDYLKPNITLELVESFFDYIYGFIYNDASVAAKWESYFLQTRREGSYMVLAYNQIKQYIEKLKTG